MITIAKKNLRHASKWIQVLVLILILNTTNNSSLVVSFSIVDTSNIQLLQIHNTNEKTINSFTFMSSRQHQQSIKHHQQQQQQQQLKIKNRLHTSLRQRNIYDSSSSTDSIQATDFMEQSNNSNNNNDKSNNNKDNDVGVNHIPYDGYSVSDTIDDEQQRRDNVFVTKLIPIKGTVGVAQLISTPISNTVERQNEQDQDYNEESFEPTRYIVAIQPPSSETNNNNTTINSNNSNNSTTATAVPSTSYVIVDVPPYSINLVQQINDFISSTTNGKIIAMIITNKESIHYNSASSTFAIPSNDIQLWKNTYPQMNIIAYRLDIPRSSHSLITQVLDGYGPFAMNVPPKETNSNYNNINNNFFIETGRPLTYDEWDTNDANDILNGRRTPPDDNNNNMNESTVNEIDDDLYSIESIRQREIGKGIIAVYTPGRTFGSISYIFPYQNICCSGYTIPIEDNRSSEYSDDEYDEFYDGDDSSIGSTGPILDRRGYITTSNYHGGGIQRQIDSARTLINNYYNKFSIILPSRGQPLFLNTENGNERQQYLLSILVQYEQIGQIYEQLGIVSTGLSP